MKTISNKARTAMGGGCVFRWFRQAEGRFQAKDRQAGCLSYLGFGHQQAGCLSYLGFGHRQAGCLSYARRAGFLFVLGLIIALPAAFDGVLVKAASFPPARLAGAAAQSSRIAGTPATTNAANTSTPDAKAYVLQGGDVVKVTVYQEDDMGATGRLENDGTILLPLLGKVNIGGKTLETAANTIQDLLAADYLVHPQVSVTIVEFGKRFFTVLGQVQKPGAYEMPADQPLNLLQAIAMAGGYTRIGSPRKVTVQRMVNGQSRIFRLDAQAMSKDKNAELFMIEPDDTITVGERII